MNRNYGKNNNGQIEFAPNALITDQSMITNPTTDQYLSFGWKRLHLESPTDPAGDKKHWEQDGLDETDTDITRKWKAVDDPVYPRHWTQLKIETAIGTSGKSVDSFHAILKGIELWAGYTAFRAYDIADYIEEFYPNAETWGSILDAIAEQSGKTRAELDAFIDTIPTEM